MKKLQIALIGVMTVIFIVSMSFSVYAGQKMFKPDGSYIEREPSFPPQPFDSGGPDEFGYSWIDSDESGGPRYEWIDITGIGTQLTMTDDNNQGPFDLGFTIDFYGNNFSSFRVCSNGWASFTSTATSYLNAAIPSATAPENLLGGFWDDLNPTDGGSIWYYTGGDSAIISYIEVPHYSGSGSGTYTYQIIILSTGEIFFQYQTMVGDLNSATIGIQNNDGTIGLQVAYDQEYVHDELTIKFSMEPEYDHDIKAVSIDAPGAFMNVGDSYTPKASYKNIGGEIETDVEVYYKVTFEGSDVYTNGQSIDRIEPLETVQVEFDGFITPDNAGTYYLSALSALRDDENPANDTTFGESNAYVDVYTEDFEADDGFFTGDNDWQWGSPTSGPNGAHSGINAWGTILDGNYTVGPLLSTLISPPIGLGANASLVFYHWYDVETNYDGGNVKISTDGGGTWDILIPDGGYDGVLGATTENPIGGEEAFTGVSDEWVMETFDLSAYSGGVVLFKFDFGSDSSIDDIGWYIDDFTVLGGGVGGSGFLAGVVTDAETTNPLEGAIVNVGGYADTTNASGEYSIELIPSVYSATASMQYYSDMTVDNIEILEDQTTEVDFALLHPEISVDTTPIDVQVAPGTTTDEILNIANTGNGELTFSINTQFSLLVGTPEGGNELIEIKLNPEETIANYNGEDHTEVSESQTSVKFPVVYDFGDLLFEFNPQTQSGDTGNLGIEFDGTYFWVTGRDADGGDIHKLHKFDRDGVYIESFEQGTSSTWGWRDIAWDGTYLYSSDENELAQIDPATGSKIGEIPMPSGYSPCRGLAYDQATDHFWTANWNSNLAEFDRDGNIINSFVNPMQIYGLAWDEVSPDGPWLWAFSQDGPNLVQISQFDPINGEYTGLAFDAMITGAMSGGAAFTTEWDPTLGVIFVLLQADPEDLVHGYEITTNSTWLTIDPTSGSVAAGDNVDITLTFDATDPDIVPDTTYNATLVINNNTSNPTISIDVSMTTGPVSVDEDGTIPLAFSLSQNYPNPFNPETNIEYTIPENSTVTLEVFNISGQKVKTLVSGYEKAGHKEVVWNGTDDNNRKVASGIYMYKLKSGDQTSVKKMSLLK
ncbi:MAG: T9SS type A sorting domain-containing protein [candidate division Zixibacteria bacterium]|nr:T9SS type A sorting domain-containing protein [candidate division Zixibacteria bacterium]